MNDFNALLDQATRPEKTVQLCMRGDLVARHEQLDRELTKAQQRARDSLAGGNVGELTDQIRAIEQEMADSTWTFRLRALRRRDFRALVAAHPPRRVVADGEEKIHEQDQFTGVNGETFHDALIRACLVDPELDDAQWERLVDSLNDRQFDELAGAAWGVNRSDVDVPFSRAASRTSPDSESE
ncbi:hypothetical protein [Actinoplanes sp. N902-109]|uniref:hypothetical protein n=1 Tax=Actinoplanes sp. (strain N902-109) TaxID=649831 RepID=UPI000329604C|nr:hypothetical protein [Actinoplanes sp. N902-109]AGL13882.1 hypothetical protein L083_0372 [Actinoplanes sp. N902-109]